MLIHHDEVYDWLNKTGRFAKKIDEEPKKDLHKCPKSDKCIMDCYHKIPHEYEEKYCNDLQGKCGTKCVNELIWDCTFFEEDFKL